MTLLKEIGQFVQAPNVRVHFGEPKILTTTGTSLIAIDLQKFDSVGAAFGIV